MRADHPLEQTVGTVCLPDLEEPLPITAHGRVLAVDIDPQDVPLCGFVRIALEGEGGSEGGGGGGRLLAKLSVKRLVYIQYNMAGALRGSNPLVE